MSLNSFRKEFVSSNSRSKSPARPLNAIELIPESRFILDIAEKLKVGPAQIEAPPPRTQRRKTTKKVSGTASSSKRTVATPRAPRHLHTNSAGNDTLFERPPYSPIDTLASVAVVAGSPDFNNAPLIYSPVRGGGYHVQVSPVATNYPAPSWGNAYHAEYNHGLDERPSKRARSEFLPSPQQGSPVFAQGSTRPATSYNSSFGWSHNVEHSIDSGLRMGVFPPSTSSSHYRTRDPVEDQTRMFDDAELLLHFSTRGASASSNHGNAKSPEVDQRPLKDVSIKTPSIPPFPFGAPNATRDSRPAVISLAPLEQREAHIVPPPAIETTGSRLETLHDKPSIQTHTPPEDVSVSIPQPEDIVLDVEKPLQSLNAAPDDFEMEDVNLRPSIELHQDSTAGDIRDGQNVPPRQLCSPQSLLAEPKEHIPSDPTPAEPTGLLIIGAQVEWSSNPKERRSSESHVSFPPEQLLRNSGRPSSVPPSNSMEIASDESPAPVQVSSVPGPSTSLTDQTTRCSGCNWAPNSISTNKVDWLQCDGCQNWYHFACAGFQPRDIRRIDKFYCRPCKGKFGGTTCNLPASTHVSL
jgi:F-box/leucine-rich repeat protein 10/11